MKNLMIKRIGGVVCRVDVKPCAVRGRKMLHGKWTEYGKEIRKAYESHEVSEKRSLVQRLEPRNDGIANAITTVSKDCMYVGRVDMENTEEKKLEDYLYTAKDGEQYGIFKLSARECFRLQGVAEKDIDRMLAVNSNTQCLKQAGNSICVPVLVAIFSQLNIQGIKPWNEMTDEERRAVIRRGCEVMEIKDEND